MNAMRRIVITTRDWLLRPGTPTPLALFRIAIGLFCLLNVALVGRSFMDVYGQYGFVQWSITRANLYAVLPHVGDVANALASYGLTANETVYLLLILYISALACLTVGLLTRLSAITAWCIHFLWIHAGGGLIYGMDMFAHIGLFYCVFMPCGATLSVDSLIRRRPAVPSVAPGLMRRVLQMQVCAIYFSAGIEKAQGIQWWNGDAIWRSLTLPTFSQFDTTWLAYFQPVAMVSGWCIIAIELGYAIFIWNIRTRRVWLCLTVGMHLSIGLMLGMWLFALIMIILNLGAFGYELLPQPSRAALEHFEFKSWWERVAVPTLERRLAP